MKNICLIAICGVLIACSPSGSETGSAKPPAKAGKPAVSLVPTQADIDYADMAIPSNKDLAGLYERSCISCHSVDGAGAPLTGHKADWDARLAASGMDGLLKVTKAGKATMPAMGMCMDCTDEDFVALITYMAEKE